MKTAEDLRLEFYKETGKGSEIPDFAGEPRTFTESYVKWLEKKVLYQPSDVSDEMIEKWADNISSEGTFRKSERYYGVILGAKAMRDGQIKPTIEGENKTLYRHRCDECDKVFEDNEPMIGLPMKVLCPECNVK